MHDKPHIQGQYERDEDDTDWCDRSEFWRAYCPKQGRGRKRKYRFRQPLILCGHGVRLRVDHGTLFIRNGFTHYPQEREEFRFFPGDASLLDRIVILDGSGGLSFDALSWFSEQQITLVQLNWRGEVNVVGSAVGHSAKRNLVEAQLAAQHGKQRIEIARWLIHGKIAASLDTLRKTLDKSFERNAATERLRRSLKRTGDALK
ncbi:MAG: CRISPR-associated endonuclease Cas1 [Alphaproteobacteria bacterium]|nr:CRISPR-associated endonuclease Cas1 [Alphaproteobacteria bacterium]